MTNSDTSQMRVDKFLFNVRLFKTRAIAAQECIKGRVLVNSKCAKPAKIVECGDTISVRVNPIFRNYKIIKLLRGRVGAAKVQEYIIETTSEDELFKLKTLREISNFSFGTRQRGTGRPTKKDRREIEKFYTPDIEEFWSDDEQETQTENF